MRSCVCTPSELASVVISRHLWRLYVIFHFVVQTRAHFIAQPSSAYVPPSYTYKNIEAERVYVWIWKHRHYTHSCHL